MQSFDVTGSNIDIIAQLFPQCVTEHIGKDGKTVRGIDFEKLRDELSADVIDEGEERYQFTWPDKKYHAHLANTPTTKTLRPCREESVDFDHTQNLYIEGDNLDVLKVLRETYLGKVKMIYIDPPYNTGSDFVYRDDFSQGTEEYKENSGQLDEEGNRLVQNTESNGRFHTDWLNMIYPRLKIAKDLLSNDGVIVISMDDNEQTNLKKVCDEIFGESNFICNFVRKNKSGSGHDSTFIAIEFDYALCYAKSIVECRLNQETVDFSSNNQYKLSDEYEKRRGKYYLRDLDYKGSYSESSDYPIIAPDGTIIYSGGKFGKPNTWRWSKSKFEWGLENGYIVFKQSNQNWKVYIKQYQFVDNNDQPYIRTIPYRADISFSNGMGSTECTTLIGSNVFSYPKPSELIKHFLKIISAKDSLVLDFFSGSATTAHAVMQLNAEDGGNRKFIMVQLPEKTSEKSEAYKAGYKNICEIGKERIRRAGRKIKEEAGLQGQDLDIGFRVLKLDSSNMKDVYYMPKEFTEQDLFADNVKPDRTPEDLLFQVMLDLGVELSATIEQRMMDGKTVFFVDGNYLVACFDTNIAEDTIKAIAKQKPLYFVMRDSSLASDSMADNFDQLFETYSKDTVRRII